jgi:Ni/Fe-hydrogenase subunit HybB-like protein
MRRVFAGLLVCSLVFGLAYAALEMASEMVGAADPWAVLTWRALASKTFLAMLFALSVLIIIGRPVFLVLKTRHRRRHAVLGAAAIAFVVDFCIALWLLAAQSPDAAVMAAVPDVFVEALRMAALGAIAGYAYWLIARPDRMFGAQTGLNSPS